MADAGADRILAAQLQGTAKRHAKWRELTGAEHDAAVGELRELAAGRLDLLAHVAGLMEGFSEGQLDEPIARQAAGLCRAAGADEAAVGEWVEVGRERRANASRPPFSDPRGRPGVQGGHVSGVRQRRTARQCGGMAGRPASQRLQGGL